MARLPHCRDPVWPSVAPDRFARGIQREPAGCRVALIGLADDLGVRLNGGRPGAKEGPGAFRAALARYGVAEPHGWDWPRVFDAGDVIPAEGDDEAALHETHRRVTEATRAVLELGLFPIGIGGGHDLTFPFVRAVIEAGGPPLRGGSAPFVGVYFDAHLDVRPTAGSGMPFRALIEQCGVRSLHVYGASGAANSREHWEWFLAHGGTPAPEVDPGRAPVGDLDQAGPIFASLDLDVIDAAHAPGVSAMNPCGWTPARLVGWCQRLGRVPGVRCFDIMELSPPHDEGRRTARLAAHLFLEFLRGFAERGA